MKLKRIEPCKILRRFGENAYEIELPEDVGISPIFNIADLYRTGEMEPEDMNIKRRSSGRNKCL
jgi:hypothetical protein